MSSHPNPPSGVEPQSPAKGGSSPKPANQSGGGDPAPSGLSSGVNVGANAPGRTGANGRQDAG